MSYSPKGRAMSPAKFANSASKGRWYCPPHLALLNQKMMAVAQRRIFRQATFMPPRHGKSEFRSKWFPAWYLGTFPDRRVILASYNADFAAEWGQKVRDILESVGEEFFGIRVRQDRRASDNWGIVGHDGGMQTCGIGGALTGRGADLLLIDDPVKDAEEAMSPTMRNRAWDWYASAADTRLEPGGAICLTMTPWNADDLGGRILEREDGLWDVLRLPALPDRPVEAEKRAARKGYDRYHGEPDPIGRDQDVPLWPERYDKSFFDRKRKQDPFWFDSLFGLSPRPRDGKLFKRAWFDGHIIAATHREARRVRAWDTAASEGAGDWTAGVRLGEHNGMWYVEHVSRFRKDPGSRNAAMRDIALLDKEKHDLFPVWVEQPAGGGGKTEAKDHIKHMAGFDIHTEPATTNKAARAAGFAAQCEAGNVKIVAGPWVEDYIDELCAFDPDSTSNQDDQVDATSLAFSKLAFEETHGYVSVSDSEYLEYEATIAGDY